MIHLSRPIIGDAERNAVDAVLRSGNLASGVNVAAFEAAFAEFCGVEHAVALGSGTAALHLGLLASGIGPGDEVIVPSFTFAASANAVAMCGATPVFADVDPDTFCITAETIAPRITNRTKGIMPVHLYGHPAEMDKINALAEAHGVGVYEDAAQAHGADWEGRRVGAWGQFGAFSFYPTKNMTTGEGGMLTTNEAEVADRTRLLRNQGMRKRYEHEISGLNERMTEIEAALGLIQLRQLDGWTSARRAHAAHYRGYLDPTLGLPREPAKGTHVYHQFTIAPENRPEVIAALEAADIGYGIYYPIPTHRQSQYAVAAADLPNTEVLSDRVLSIPVRPDLTSDELSLIVATLNAVVA
jgi:perosamine synthetase